MTKAVSSLTKRTLFAGALSLTPSVSVAFRTGASGALERGAVLNEATALHVTIQRAAPYASGVASVSAQVAALRRLLLGGEERGETGLWFRQAAEVSLPSHCGTPYLKVVFVGTHPARCRRRLGGRDGDAAAAEGRGGREEGVDDEDGIRASDRGPPDRGPIG